MKRNANNMTGFTLKAVDGEIGKVKEFYFDDQSWTVRYLIVETGSWLAGKKVLIAPKEVLKADWDGKDFEVKLTIDQIKNSPDIDTEQPVSKQQELELYNHYNWGDYWGGGLWDRGIGTTGMLLHSTFPFEDAISREVSNRNEASDNNQHLRSTRELKGYIISVFDGDIGHVEDFIIDDETWKVEFIVVDTGNWWAGKQVLVSPEWIKEIKWETSSVAVNSTKNGIKNSPEYHSTKPLTEDYKQELHRYYTNQL